MGSVVYIILGRSDDTFNILYAGESQKTEETDFFTKNDKFKCWLTHAGSEDNLYLAIFPMDGSEEKDRAAVVNKTIAKYKPICNLENA